MDGEDSEAEIYSAQQSLDEAQKTLETAELLTWRVSSALSTEITMG